MQKAPSLAVNEQQLMVRILASMTLTPVRFQHCVKDTVSALLETLLETIQINRKVTLNVSQNMIEKRGR